MTRGLNDFLCVGGLLLEGGLEVDRSFARSAH